MNIKKPYRNPKERVGRGGLMEYREEKKNKHKILFFLSEKKITTKYIKI